MKCSSQSLTYIYLLKKSESLNIWCVWFYDGEADYLLWRQPSHLFKMLFSKIKSSRWNRFASGITGNLVKSKFIRHMCSDESRDQSSSCLISYTGSVKSKSWKLGPNHIKMVGEIVKCKKNKTLLFSDPLLIVIVKKPTCASQPGARWTNWTSFNERADVVGEAVQLRAPQFQVAQTNKQTPAPLEEALCSELLAVRSQTWTLTK